MSSNPTEQIRACISEQENYKTRLIPVIEEISKSNKIYIEALVNFVFQAIKDKNEKNSSKYAALILLKEALDTKNPDLITCAQERLIEVLGKLANDDASRIVHEDIELKLKIAEAKLVVDFDQLLLECIDKCCLEKSFCTEKATNVLDLTNKDWQSIDIENLLKGVYEMKNLLQDSLTNTEEPNEEILALVYNQLKGMNKRLQYRLKELLIYNIPNNEITLNKVLGENNFTLKYIDEYEKLQRGELSMKQFRDLLLNKTRTSRVDDIRNLLMESLSDGDHKLQENGKEISSTNTSTKSVLAFVYEEFNEINQQLQDKLKELLRDDVSENQKQSLNKILKESNFVLKYLGDYEKLQKGEMSMHQFKASIIDADINLKETILIPKQSNTEKQFSFKSQENDNHNGEDDTVSKRAIKSNHLPHSKKVYDINSIKEEKDAYSP